GIYKVLLMLTSPASVAARLPALSAQYLDFPGEGKTEMPDKQHAVMSRTQLPAMLASWFTLVYETYVDVTLTAAGAKSVLVRPPACARSGLRRRRPCSRSRRRWCRRR